MPQRNHYTLEFKLEIAKLMVEQNDALQQACEASDQGCQYTSHAYQDRLAELGIKVSWLNVTHPI